MKLDIQFKELEILVSNMGASAVEWKSDVAIETLESDWKIQLETTGIEVNVNDVEIKPNGLLHYRGEQILLYIKEVQGFSDNLPKYHFTQCQTLTYMQRSGRFDRYVVTQRKDGYFLIDRKVGYNDYKKDNLEKLVVCKNCLGWYGRHNKRFYNVEDFNIDAFFEQFNNTPIIKKPTYTDITAPASGYTEDWNNISNNLKERKNWTCEQCGRYLKNQTGLHVHHISGVKSDNSSSNLKVLCEYCHAEQPNHQHMRRR